MSGECSNLAHRRGTTAGRTIRETPRNLYVERICPACGRVQGIARVPKVQTWPESVPYPDES